MSNDNPSATLLAALNAFLRALPAQEPQYCLIGGVALAAWGQVRATLDLDFLILLNDQTRSGLLASLGSHGFVVDTRWTDANPMLKGTMTRLTFGPHPVDLLEPRDAHDRETLGRRRKVQVDQSNLWVASPEDLILLKLKAGRHLDYADAVSIVVRQGKALNLDYLWSWADRLGLQGELTQVLKGSSPSS
jgi:hypothetical protein